MTVLNPNVITYSAIHGDYDKDRDDIHIFRAEESDKFKLDVMNSKIYKILSHKYFPEHDNSIWIDANINLKVDIKVLLDEFLKDADIALFHAPFSDCIYKRVEAIKTRLHSKYHKILDEQILTYKKDGFPAEYGMGQCGMIIRKNNDIVSEFNERWWSEICRYTNRDQVSFPYVWWKMKDRIKIKLIKGQGNVRSHPYFTYTPHL